MSSPKPIAILIVDDVDTMRALLSHVIASIPHLAVSGQAKNGWEARLELSRRRPDLILLDEILPGESSVDLLREFAAQKIPVLLMTGLEEPSHPLPPETAGRLNKPRWDDLEADTQSIQKTIFSTISR